MIPLAVPNVSGRESEYLQDCIESTFVSSVGPYVDQFERMVADAAGASGAIAVSAGTTGLHLALHVLGVGANDLVALPSLTFIASANAISHCGASPWLFDVDPLSWTLDVRQLEQSFQDHLDPGAGGPIHRPTGRRLAAIMPVHTLGHPADMDAIVALGQKYGVPVVADAAAALGASYRTRPVGQAEVAASVFSFNGNKTVTCGGGGAVVSNDDEFLVRARHVSTTARAGPGYDHDEVGFNYRMTNLAAAVGCAQMERLDEFVSVKRRCQAAYSAVIENSEDAVPFPQASWARSANWFSGFWLPGWPPLRVQTLQSQLREDGIDARPFWKPMHIQEPYVDVPTQPQYVTDQVWSRVVTLPCSTGITDEELELVGTAVRRRLAG